MNENVYAKSDILRLNQQKFSLKYLRSHDFYTLIGKIRDDRTMTAVTYMLCGSNIPKAVQAYVASYVIREVCPKRRESEVLALFDKLHSLCDPYEGCHFAVAIDGVIYRTGAIYTEFVGGLISCEGNHTSMSQGQRDARVKARLRLPRFSTVSGGVGTLIDEGPTANSFHRDQRATFATVSIPGGLRVQTSIGYAGWLPTGSNKPFILRGYEFRRFLEPEVGDALKSLESLLGLNEMEKVWWDHEVFGRTEAHTFNI